MLRDATICLQSIFCEFNLKQFFYFIFSFQVDNVRILDRYNSKNPSVGTLYLTATHLIFAESEANKEIWVRHSDVILFCTLLMFYPSHSQPIHTYTYTQRNIKRVCWNVNNNSQLHEKQKGNTEYLMRTNSSQISCVHNVLSRRKIKNVNHKSLL